MIIKQIIMVMTILFGTPILMTTQKMELIVIASNVMKQGYKQVLVLILSPFSSISLVVEGTYRRVNFKNWIGSGDDSWNWDEQWGRSDLGYSTDSGNESDTWSGKIWYYELYDSDLDKQYGFLSLHEEAPEADEFIKNVRVGKININGFSFRAGIRISF
jgi:hypothetical protein